MRDSLVFQVTVGTLAVLAVTALAIFGLIRGLALPMDKSACYSFGEQSGRQVRFVEYNWGSWDCLTPSADGKWISAKNLREEVGR